MVVDSVKPSGEVKKVKEGQFPVGCHANDVIENPQKSRFGGMALLIGRLVSQH